MSTLIGNVHKQILKSEEDLAHYFQSHAKDPSNVKVGVEVELLGVNCKTGKALPYHGPVGIQEVLRTIAEDFGYQTLLDQDKVIGLQRGDRVIALEPGGQIELSAPPVRSVFDVEAQIEKFLCELRDAQKKLGCIRWLAVGIQPLSPSEEIEWVPKKRYEILAEYLRTHGTLSHHMMKRTATNQFNFDYTSESDGLQKFRVAMSVTSLISALFANASFSEGRPNGYASYRLEIWNHTSPERAGLLAAFLEEGKRFQDYLEYVLEIPLIFIVRDDEWIPVRNLNFRQYLRQGYQGLKATLGDFELHLSSIFSEARFKQYMEVRGLDCQSPALIPAATALWKGILYDAKALQDAWNLVSFARPQDRITLHQVMAKEGLQARLSGRPLAKLAEELVEIAAGGLKRQATAQKKPDESPFLERIREKILKPGKSPGELLIEKWNGEFAQDPQKLLQYLGI